MIPETGKLVPNRPPANKSVAETTILENHDLYPAHPQRRLFRTHLGLRSTCAPFLNNNHDGDEQSEQQRAIAVLRVRAEVRDEAAPDVGERIRHRDAGGVAEELIRPAKNEHPRQRHDEGRNADISDPPTLPSADDGSHREAKKNCDCRREVPARH